MWDDDCEGFFLFQKLSVCVQRFNAVLLHDGFSINQLDWRWFQLILYFLNFWNTWDFVPDQKIEYYKNNNNNNNTKIYYAHIVHIKHESEVWASHQVARRSVLIVNELGYEMRLLYTRAVP